MNYKPKGVFYQINHYIKSDKLRVIDSAGKQIGVISKSDALNMANSANLDLVVVAPSAKHPVAKIIDFKKFKYQQNKKQRESGKSSKVELKEIRFSPFIADGDLETRLERIKEFLGDGDRVKIVVKFSGRQITRKEFGYELLTKILESLEGVAVADGESKLQGKQLYQIIQAAPKTKNEKKD